MSWSQLYQEHVEMIETQRERILELEAENAYLKTQTERAYRAMDNNLFESAVKLTDKINPLVDANERIAELEAALKRLTREYIYHDHYGDALCIHCQDNHINGCPWVQAKELLDDKV